MFALVQLLCACALVQAGVSNDVCRARTKSTLFSWYSLAGGVAEDWYGAALQRHRQKTFAYCTVHNHFKRFLTTGNLSPVRPTPSYQEHEVVSRSSLSLDFSSIMYLNEVCQTITHCMAFESLHRRFVVSFTDVVLPERRVSKTIVAIQRSVEQRGMFMAEVQFFNANQFVWVDETGSKWQQRSDPEVWIQSEGRATCSQSIFASRISASDGVLACTFTKGTVNGENFLDFIQGRLLAEVWWRESTLHPCVGQLFNTSRAASNRHFEADGVLTLFLSPYSPDMNPIEELFSHFKYYLKDHDIVLHAMRDPLPCLNLEWTLWQQNNAMPGSNMLDIK